MDAREQDRLLQRIEKDLNDARLVARQLTGSRPIIDGIEHLNAFVTRWRLDLQKVLTPDPDAVCFGVDASAIAKAV